MSRTEKFISDCTRNCSNYTGVINKKTCECYYVPWLTPDDAKKAVEIAREEVTKKAYAAFCKVCKLNCNPKECYYLNNFKQAMKDE